MPPPDAARTQSWLIAPEDQRRQLWKNGGGTTTEVALAQDGGGVLWRVSIAGVTADGPFSLFPGMERTLAVIDGTGLRLSVDGAPPVTVTPSAAAFRFSGDSSVACTLAGGAVRVFNLMVDRTRLSGDVRRVTPAQPVAVTAATVLVYALDGDALVCAGENQWRLPAGHALRVDGADGIETHGDAMLAVVGPL